MAEVCWSLSSRRSLSSNLSPRYFKSPKGALLGIYAASFFIPSIFTAFVGDIISTKLGRRWCILIGNMIILAGSLVSTFATSIGMWCGGESSTQSGNFLYLTKDSRACHHGSWSWHCEGCRSCLDPGDCSSPASTYSRLFLHDICLYWKFFSLLL